MTALERLTLLTQNDQQERELEYLCLPLDCLGLILDMALITPTPTHLLQMDGKRISLLDNVSNLI